MVAITSLIAAFGALLVAILSSILNYRSNRRLGAEMERIKAAEQIGVRLFELKFATYSKTRENYDLTGYALSKYIDMALTSCDEAPPNNHGEMVKAAYEEAIRASNALRVQALLLPKELKAEIRGLFEVEEATLKSLREAMEFPNKIERITAIKNAMKRRVAGAKNSRNIFDKWQDTFELLFKEALEGRRKTSK